MPLSESMLIHHPWDNGTPNLPEVELKSRYPVSTWGSMFVSYVYKYLLKWCREQVDWYMARAWPSSQFIKHWTQGSSQCQLKCVTFKLRLIQSPCTAERFLILVLLESHKTHWSSIQQLIWTISQILKALGWTLIWYWFEVMVLDQCLINVDQSIFAIRVIMTLGYDIF